jgi:hypothetical protein
MIDHMYTRKMDMEEISSEGQAALSLLARGILRLVTWKGTKRRFSRWPGPCRKGRMRLATGRTFIETMLLKN